METTFPTPLEILLDPVALMILGMFAALAFWEAVAPAKALPAIRGLLSFTAFFTCHPACR